ncbi:paraneoplastic antigen Ma2 homolog isoform X2 [Heterocephalus glaber]|nr:paraneoplastic antigen Ma2 homolog isoform X2 [Heterocephalus glaber]
MAVAVGVAGAAGEPGAAGAAGEAGAAGAADEEGAAGMAGAVGVAPAAGVAGAAGEAGAADGARVSDEEGAAGDIVEGAIGVVGMAGAAGEAGPPEEGAWDAAAATHHRAGAQQWDQALQPILENVAYQELRPFSGIPEQDPEEESFESWLNHANDMLYLWRHISERERRRRLVECLEGPALDVICELLEEHPDIPVQDCLAMLVQVFGNKDIGVTTRLKFLICSQGPRETLLAYVMRLEGLLQSAVEKGAILPAAADQMRARQVMMWARPNWILQNKLRRMQLERRPPGFRALFHLVLETEAWEAALAGNELLGGEATEAGPSHREAAGPGPGPAPAVEDASQASPAGEEASAQAASDSECAAEVASDTNDATKSTTQEDEETFGPAGLGQAGPSEAPEASTSALVCSVSGAGPGGPGYGPESLAQAAEQGAEEFILEGLKAVLEELGNEVEDGEMSHPESSSRE